MKKLMYILLLFPFFGISQIFPDLFLASQQQAGGVVNPQLHAGPNAASDQAGNESNTTTGWTAVQVTLTSSSIDPQTGTYHLQIVAADGSLDRADYSFAAEIGAQYEVSIWAREEVGTDGRIQLFSGLTGWTTETLTGTWANYTQTVTATDTTAIIRVYAASNSGAPGDTVYFDNISIIKVADP